MRGIDPRRHAVSCQVIVVAAKQDETHRHIGQGAFRTALIEHAYIFDDTSGVCEGVASLERFGR